MITTHRKPSKNAYFFISEVMALFPNCHLFERGSLPFSSFLIARRPLPRGDVPSRGRGRLHASHRHRRKPAPSQQHDHIAPPHRPHRDVQGDIVHSARGHLGLRRGHRSQSRTHPQQFQHATRPPVRPVLRLHVPRSAGVRWPARRNVS